MKKLALIAAVVITTISLQSCRQSDDFMSPEEAATLQRVQNSTTTSLQKNSTNTSTNQQNTPPTESLDGELLPPPRK